MSRRRYGDLAHPHPISPAEGKERTWKITTLSPNHDALLPLDGGGWVGVRDALVAKCLASGLRAPHPQPSPQGEGVRSWVSPPPKTYPRPCFLPHTPPITPAKGGLQRTVAGDGPGRVPFAGVLVWGNIIQRQSCLKESP